MGSTRPAGSRLVDVSVDVDDRQQAHPVQAESLVALLTATIAAQHDDIDAETPTERRVEVGLAFIDVEEMTQLNGAHMGGSGPTDVLAFPIDGVDGIEVPHGQPMLLGDIVVCPEVAARAPQPLDDELALLVVHGALHLLGHDHAEPNETALMKSLEVDMLERFHSA